MEYFDYIVDNGYLWLAISLFAAMFVTQLIKQIVKAHGGFIPKGMRRGVIFGIAFIVGYVCALYFLKDTGMAHAEKWSIAVALFNPAVYLALVEYAHRNQKMWLLAMLKQRPLNQDANGVLNPNETQVFMKGDD